jgi:hypothetical protein
VGSVLLTELPPDDPNREYYTCDLAGATAKGGYGREYWMSRLALQEALTYVEGERAASVRRAQRAGRYVRLPRARVIVVRWRAGGCGCAAWTARSARCRRMP